MKKILLILLCLPMIGFGQNVSTSEIYLADNISYTSANFCDEIIISTGSYDSLQYIFEVFSEINDSLFDVSDTIEFYWTITNITNQIVYSTFGFYGSTIFATYLDTMKVCYSAIFFSSSNIDTCISCDYFYWDGIEWSVLNIATNLIEESKNKIITNYKITNLLGKETPYRRNTPLLYLYDDGTVEKRIVID